MNIEIREDSSGTFNVRCFANDVEYHIRERLDKAGVVAQIESLMLYGTPRSEVPRHKAAEMATVPVTSGRVQVGQRWRYKVLPDIVIRILGYMTGGRVVVKDTCTYLKAIYYEKHILENYTLVFP